MAKSLDEQLIAAEQALANQQATVANIREKLKKRDDGMKFVLAGAILAELRESQNQSFARLLHDILSVRVTRPSDKRRISDLMIDLQNILDLDLDLPEPRPTNNDDLPEAIRPI